MRPAALLVLAAGLLSACSTTQPQPAPALSLNVQALDAGRALVQLDPAPAAARWEVRPSAECGDVDGLATASGPWPAPALLLEVPARAGDLVTVTATLEDGTITTAADCPADVRLLNHR